jgi:hypothetical protein
MTSSMSGEVSGGEMTVASKAEVAPTTSAQPPVHCDRDLLVAYASGDEAAFETLAAKYSRMPLNSSTKAWDMTLSGHRS